MPRSHLRIRMETRVLGAIQIVIGLIVYWLGLIWTYLLVTQVIAFGNAYLPLAAAIGYPLWSSLSFVLSGIFAVLLERKRSRLLVTWTITLNIISACIAMIGLVLLSLEFLIFRLSSKIPIWPQKSGKLLSQYLFLFNFLEFSVTCTVVHWAYKAKYRR